MYSNTNNNSNTLNFIKVLQCKYLSQFMQRPKVSYWEAGFRLVRCIKGCSGQEILVSSDLSAQFEGFCDLDWITCPNTSGSVTGDVVKLGSSLISWNSKKQHCTQKLSWSWIHEHINTSLRNYFLVGVMKEMDAFSDTPVKLHCDGKAAIQISANTIFHEETKHFEINCHFVREKIEDGLIQTENINT